MHAFQRGTAISDRQHSTLQNKIQCAEEYFLLSNMVWSQDQQRQVSPLLRHLNSDYLSFYTFINKSEDVNIHHLGSQALHPLLLPVGESHNKIRSDLQNN